MDIVGELLGKAEAQGYLTIEDLLHQLPGNPDAFFQCLDGTPHLLDAQMFHWLPKLLYFPRQISL